VNSRLHDRSGDSQMSSQNEGKHGQRWYVCKCDCGREASVCEECLQTGRSTECPWCSAASAGHKLELPPDYDGSLIRVCAELTA
jgi:hypothetical protein